MNNGNSFEELLEALPGRIRSVTLLLCFVFGIYVGFSEHSFVLGFVVTLIALFLWEITISAWVEG